MQKGFWADLSLPIVGLAPMDGVTDQPFRHLQKKYGNPDVIYTEFTSADGICHNANKLLTDFLYDETQRPVVAQIFGKNPEYFRQTAVLLCELGFDGIDINMGCPAKTVTQHGSGAALIRTPKLAQEIVRQTQLGVQDWLNGMTSRDCPDITTRIWKEVERRHNLLPAKYQERREVPVTVKTRIGFDEEVVAEWIPYLLETEPVVIAIHGRTLKQAYGGAADWDAIAKAVALAKKSETMIFGNGDVTTRNQAEEYVQKYGVDGVLIGRGSFGNPYVFLDETAHQPKSRYQLAIEHAQLFEETYGHDERFHFFPMRKHLGWYVKGIEGAKELRVQLMQANSADEVKAILANLH